VLQRHEEAQASTTLMLNVPEIRTSTSRYIALQNTTTFGPPNLSHVHKHHTHVESSQPGGSNTRLSPSRSGTRRGMKSRCELQQQGSGHPNLAAQFFSTPTGASSQSSRSVTHSFSPKKAGGSVSPAKGFACLANLPRAKSDNYQTTTTTPSPAGSPKRRTGTDNSINITDIASIAPMSQRTTCVVVPPPSISPPRGGCGSRSLGRHANTRRPKSRLLGQKSSDSSKLISLAEDTAYDLLSAKMRLTDNYKNEKVIAYRSIERPMSRGSEYLYTHTPENADLCSARSSNSGGSPRTSNGQEKGMYIINGHAAHENQALKRSRIGGGGASRIGGGRHTNSAGSTRSDTERQHRAPSAGSRPSSSIMSLIRRKASPRPEFQGVVSASKMSIEKKGSDLSTVSNLSAPKQAKSYPWNARAISKENVDADVDADLGVEVDTQENENADIDAYANIGARGGEEAGVDANSGVDAGTSGAGVHAGVDANSGVDAGTSGAGVHAGINADAGVDAGTSDAGVHAGVDGDTGVDAGTSGAGVHAGIDAGTSGGADGVAVDDPEVDAGILEASEENIDARVDAILDAYAHSYSHGHPHERGAYENHIINAHLKKVGISQRTYTRCNRSAKGVTLSTSQSAVITTSRRAIPTLKSSPSGSGTSTRSSSYTGGLRSNRTCIGSPVVMPQVSFNMLPEGTMADESDSN